MRGDVLARIRAHEVAMRPRVYFTLRFVALVAVSVAILLISIFIFNFILFSIRLNGDDALLGFGPRGIEAFLRFFPWTLLVLDIALVMLLQWLLRSFRFGYKRPVLPLLGGLLLFTLVAGLAMDRGTGVNEQLLRGADRHLLPPPFGDVYGRVRHDLPPGSGLWRGSVTAINGNKVTVAVGTTSLTFLLPDNDDRATTTDLHVGDPVLVAGDQKDGVIQAFGLRKLDPALDSMQRDAESEPDMK